MHPGFYWWNRAREAAGAAACGVHAGHGPGHHGPHDHGESRHFGGFGHGGPGDDGGHGGLGVRRPLRFLAHRLDLKESQVAELARILNELKTERAQAEVDDRRTHAAFADAVAGESFDPKRADEGAEIRLASAKRLREAVGKALASIHALLDAEQRGKLAYMIRTGTLTL